MGEGRGGVRGESCRTFVEGSPQGQRMKSIWKGGKHTSWGHARAPLCLIAQCLRGSALGAFAGVFLQALSVGIFPYVLKLLQSQQPDLRSILLFIWVKILALHRVCHGRVWGLYSLCVPPLPPACPPTSSEKFSAPSAPEFITTN